MLVSALALGLASLAAASPVGTIPHYPPKSQSKGFNLVVNVTDRSHDFTPSIQNKYINSIHVGAGLALVGVGKKPENPRIFYQNGTVQEHRDGQSTVISDGGTPPSPFGLSFTKDQGSTTVSTAHLNGGVGTKGVAISRFPEPYAFLLPETYAVCNESIAYYQGAPFLILKQAATTVGSDGQINHNIPEGCAPVRLIPECTKLNDLPPKSYSSHEFALDSDCYKDVQSIDWCKYGP